MIENVVAVVILSIITLGGMIALGSSRWTVPAGRAAVPDNVVVRPALVHFMLTGCHPGTAAYDATILDLAARGFIGARGDAAGIWLIYKEPGTAAAGVALAGYEQQVLDALHGRLKNTGGAPFGAVAQACRVDVGGTWAPFEQELRAAARAGGICRRQLPLSAGPLVVGAGTEAAAVGLAALATMLSRHHTEASAIRWAVVTAVASPLVLAGIAVQDRLTPAGAGLAARWKAERARLAADPASWGMTAAGPGGSPEVTAGALPRRAFAVAGAIPGAGPDPVMPGQRLSRRVSGVMPSAKTAPSQAWSSFSGTWRLVPIKNIARSGMGYGVSLIGFGFFLGFVAYMLSLPGGTEPLPIVALAAALTSGGFGVRDVIRKAGIPTRVTCNGQVIARWVEDSDSETSSDSVSQVAIDDGTQAWIFCGPMIGHLGLEDLVRMTINPRTGGLIELSVLEQQRPRTPTEAEQAARQLRRRDHRTGR